MALPFIDGDAEPSFLKNHNKSVSAFGAGGRSMKDKHRLSLGDFSHFELDHRIASSADKTTSKALDLRIVPITRSVMFVVRFEGKLIFHTNSLELAIEKYNELP